MLLAILTFCIYRIVSAIAAADVSWFAKMMPIGVVSLCSVQDRLRLQEFSNVTTSNPLQALSLRS